MIVIDVEIKKAIQGRNEERVPGIEYCDGWRDFANMGIACVCTYDTRSHLSRVFLEDELEEFSGYVGPWITSGFNTVGFDLKLLRTHGAWPTAGESPHFDILREIWCALDLDPDRFVPQTHGGWSLDAVAGATINATKSGNGALAPVWWQQGKRGRVIDYCLRDVWLEGQLLMHIIEHGWVTNGRQRVEVRVPQELLRVQETR